MQPEDGMRVGHILDAARRVARWLADVSLPEFQANEQLHLAVLFSIQVVGESANNLTDEFKQALPGIPWREIVGMRNRIVHGYFLIDIDIVWEAATIYLPDLALQLSPYAPAEEE